MSERDLPSRGQPAPPHEVAPPSPTPDAEVDIDAPESDTVEQHQDAGDVAETIESAGEPPLTAEQADVAEQRRVVEPEEDEYREDREY